MRFCVVMSAMRSKCVRNVQNITHLWKIVQKCKIFIYLYCYVRDKESKVSVGKGLMTPRMFERSGTWTARLRREKKMFQKGEGNLREGIRKKEKAGDIRIHTAHRLHKIGSSTNAFAQNAHAFHLLENETTKKRQQQSGQKNNPIISYSRLSRFPILLFAFPLFLYYLPPIFFSFSLIFFLRKRYVPT